MTFTSDAYTVTTTVSPLEANSILRQFFHGIYNSISTESTQPE